MSHEIKFRVSGLPPAKSETLSLFGAGHGHAERVVALLTAAREQASLLPFDGFGDLPIGLELTVACRRDGKRSDATNYLGGVADVLEDKSHRGNLDHLEELSSFALYANDRQIEEVQYRWQPSATASYTVRLWALDAEG
jgi:hypothetical protein